VSGALEQRVAQRLRARRGEAIPQVVVFGTHGTPLARLVTYHVTKGKSALEAAQRPNMAAKGQASKNVSIYPRSYTTCGQHRTNRRQFRGRGT
jgi:hypothetical protein